MNWTYSIAFDLEGVGKLSNAESLVEKLDGSVEELTEEIDRLGRSFDETGETGRKSFSSMKSGALGFIATLGIGLATLGSLKTAAQDQVMNMSIDFATNAKGAESIAMVEEVSDRLGTSLLAGKEGFKILAGSMRGTNLEGKETEDIFKGITSAGAAMGLSQDDIQGAYLAVSQMASKGKVQAEELKGQLGERLPGAFKLAADSMGVTQATLNKMLETGQVTAEDFLPKFAAQLEKTFGPQAAAMSEGPVANMNRFKNATYELSVVFGTELLPIATAFLRDFAIPATRYIADNIEIFTSLAITLGTVWAAIKLVSFWTEAYTAVQWLLNAAMTANPIGIVIVTLGALALGIANAWNKFEGFRGFIVGMWEVFKELHRIVYDFAVKPFLMLGKVVFGALTFNKDMLASSITEAAKMMQSNAESAGQRISESYNKGWNKGAGSGAGATDAVSSAFAKSDTAGNYGSNNTNTTPPTGGIEGITGRGQSKNITINLGSLVQELQIKTTSMTEVADEIESIMTRKLLQVLNTANQTQ